MLPMVELVVAVAAGYWAWFYLARGRRSYGAFVALAALAAFLGYLGPRIGLAEGTAGLVGGLGVVAAFLLLVVGPLCRAVARAVVQGDRLRLAGALLEIADVLMPGAGVGDDKLALAALREVRAGRIDETVAALQHGKSRLPPALCRAIDERIAMLYLSAHRWKDAIDHVDRHLARPPQPAAPASDGEPRDAWAAARAALGMSPPLWVELLGAVAREGDLDRAAVMLRDLEAACGDREDAYWIVHRGRLVFLAFAGRTAAVDRLVGPELARHMSRSARSYWRGIAAAHAGDTAGAQGAYQQALAGSRGRARELVTRALDELPATRPASASELVQSVADAAETAPLTRPEPPLRPRRIATTALLALNAAALAAIAIAFGAPSDPGVVVRAGGALRSAIDHGEWWRLVTAVVVHIGIVHLVLNLLGLFAIGRWAEAAFGWRATLAIYAVAGIAGAAASYLAGTAPLSAGASGAIFGLLGAFVVEVAIHRRVYRAMWASGMAGALLLAVAAQLALGFSFAIDQWAHAGGFAAGAIAGVALSPHRTRKRAVAAVATVIAVAFVAVVAVAVVQVARTDFADTLARYPRAVRTLDGVAITVPARWVSGAGGEYVDDDLYMLVAVERGDGQPLDRWLAAEAERARERRFDAVQPASDRRFALPPDWTGVELVATAHFELFDQTYRVLAAGRADGARAAVYVPESLAADAAAQLVAMLGSITIDPPRGVPEEIPAPAP
jgi:rhomboid protease GluP